MDKVTLTIEVIYSRKLTEREHVRARKALMRAGKSLPIATLNPPENKTPARWLNITTKSQFVRKCRTVRAK